ncbi:MAG: acylphosphatase, partial [Oceanobacter sp.]
MNQALPPDALDKHKKAATKQAERIIQVSGRVQGVGFRPYVWQLANQLGLNGDVCNDGGQVRIRVSGATVQLDEFIRRLPDEAPELARIHSVEVLANSEFSFDLSSCESGHDSDCESGFQILPSSDSHSLQQRAIAPDTAPCEHCLNELFDPGNRRYGYPFINCTQCGPRYSLMRQLPYDRANTSMAEFELCDACGEEYQNPADRRFHAQPNACSSCGPEVWFESFYGQSHEQPFEKAEGLSSIESVIDQTLSAIARGEIVGIRGVGGFHLVCDARNPEAIARLRQRKQRPT